LDFRLRGADPALAGLLHLDGFIDQGAEHLGADLRHALRRGTHPGGCYEQRGTLVQIVIRDDGFVDRGCGSASALLSLSGVRHPPRKEAQNYDRQSLATEHYVLTPRE